MLLKFILVLTPLFAKVVSVKYICVSDKPSEILRWDIKNSGIGESGTA